MRVAFVLLVMCLIGCQPYDPQGTNCKTIAREYCKRTAESIWTNYSPCYEEETLACLERRLGK